MTVAYGGPGHDILAARFLFHGDKLMPTDLRGGPGADLVRGQRSDDELRGGPGPDRLSAHGGNDVVNGRDGSDVIAVEDRRHDHVNCGPGADRVRRDWRDHLVHCEKVS